MPALAGVNNQQILTPSSWWCHGATAPSTAFRTPRAARKRAALTVAGSSLLIPDISPDPGVPAKIAEASIKAGLALSPVELATRSAVEILGAIVLTRILISVVNVWADRAQKVGFDMPRRSCIEGELRHLPCNHRLYQQIC